jgi:hypothetical protein
LSYSICFLQLEGVSSLKMLFECKWQGQRVTHPLLISIVLRHQSNSTWQLNHLNMQMCFYFAKEFCFTSLLRKLLKAIYKHNII